MLTVVVLLVNATLSYRSTVWMDEARLAARRSAQTVSALDELLRYMLDAESSLRAFVISGDEGTLKPFNDARLAMGTKLESFSRFYQDRPERKEAVDRLSVLVVTKIAELAEAINLRRTLGYTDAARIGASRIDSLAELRRAVDALHAQETAILESHRADENARLTFLRQSLVIITFGDILLFGLFYYVVFRSLNERRRNAEALEEANAQMQESYANLERRNHQIETQSAMIAALQSCPSSEEAFAIIARFCEKLLDDCAGVIYNKRPTSELMEEVAMWGSPSPRTDSFEPDACWALRRAEPHRMDAADVDLVCPHRQSTAVNPPPSYMCVPLAGQGETLGLIFLECREPDTTVARSTEQLARTIADQAGLAVSNLRLRETLRQHAIIDPLTGLYNRRYFDETVRREFARAARREVSIAFIIADADHFKRFNDTHGHDAGDLVLRSLAHEMQHHIRSSDIACRYGGEEFVVVLPEATIDIALKRAEAIRAGMETLQIEFAGKSLGAITVSLGVAVYPEHGANADALFQAADRALYRAKRDGRNRVALAEAAALA
ncbi:MAG: diguanylate cyclase [Burkholderiales bacterium]